MTNEIKRLLRNLDEACAEQGISIDSAIAWFKDFKQQQNIPQKFSEHTFRSVVTDLLDASCIENQIHKKICIEALCLAYEERETTLLANDVLDRLLEAKLIPTRSFGRNFAKEIIYDFLYDYYQKQGIDDPRRIIGKPSNWHSICHDMRNLVKTLN